LALAEKIHSHCPHDRSIYPVLTCRASAALHVSQDRCPCLNACRFLDPLRHIDGVTDTFGIDDDIVLFAALLILHDILDQSLLVEIVLLRHQDTLCAVGDTTPQGQVSRITSHNLDDTASLMGCR